MPNRLCCVADPDTASTVQLRDGFAEVMGEGLFVIFQTEPGGTVNQIVISEGDLRRLLLNC